MRRIPLGLVLVAVPVFALTVFVAGCGKDDKKDQSSSGGGSGGGETKDDKKASGPAKVVESKGGVLRGKVTLASKPDVKKMTDDLLKAIDDKKDQKDYCLKGSETEKTEQQFRIGKNGNLGNVFVWVLPASGTIFKVSSDQLAAAKKPVKMDQPHCAFVPHCAVAFVEYSADPNTPSKKTSTGQTIEIHNSAEVSHNTNYAAGPRNPKNDVTLKPNGEPMKIEKLQVDSTPMKLKCGIHPWMDAYIRLVDTPYYAITFSDTAAEDFKVKDSDDKFGTYEIKNLPTGKVRVVAWHEQAGYLTGSASGEEIEIQEGKPTEKDFTATPK